MKQNTSETTSPNNKRLPILKKIAWNKYSLAIILFIIWMIFFDNTSWLVINFYKNEFEKNDKFYKKLMLNKSEKEKFARENYFMKKSNEEIFILVIDSSSLAQKNK